LRKINNSKKIRTKVGIKIILNQVLRDEIKEKKDSKQNIQQSKD
jgi:hypothetical protein